MKLHVPFYPQEGAMDCGIAALRMALAYFGTTPSVDELVQRTGMVQGKGLWTLQLATGAALSGHQAEFNSKQIGFNPAHLELDFYKKHADLMITSDVLIAQAKHANVLLHERTYSLPQLLERVNADCVPIVLIDWNVIMPREGKNYQGHFVLLAGYDDTHVFIHNPGPHNAQAHVAVPRDLFDAARKARGTDEDVVFVFRTPL